MWPTRAEVVYYSFKDKKTAKKGMKMAKKMNAEEVMKALNEKDALAVTAETRMLNQEQFSELTEVSWAVGMYPQEPENNRIKSIQVVQIVEPQVKPLNKNLGQVTSDYQNELEAQWINALKSKYPVEVFQANVAKLY